MAQVATITPLNQFFSLGGAPLNNGKVYFGEVSKDPEQFPITVYWDAAGLVPALQPIRTTSGYPSRSGSPAILYVDSLYSMRVRQSNDVQVYYIPSTGTPPPETPTPFVDTELTPSYASANSFTLTGDQTGEFQPGRRARMTLGSGFVYGSITTSVFGALTTVTLDMDGASALDNSLSAVALSFFAVTPYALPSVAEFVNAQTGTTYTYQAADQSKLVTHTNAAAIAGTLPVATSFPDGWWADVQNRGAGILTITPTTSTIDGAASIALTTNQGLRIVSDGTNYFTQRGVGVSEAYAYLREEQASGTDGGAFTSGSWQKRVINTEVNDASGIVSISSSQMTLVAGTYRFRASAPAWAVDFHKLKLINVTDTIEYIGTSEIAPTTDSVLSASTVVGRFTITSAKVFELQHRCQTTKTVNGLGRPTSFSVVEIYAQIEFWKEITA